MAKKRLRRGFRKEAEEYAEEFRFELNLEPHAPLCPCKLSNHLEIPVCKLSEHPSIPDDVKNYFLGPGSNYFSATVIPFGTYREIVHNDAHHLNRQNSNVMHEVAHIILGHPPSPPLIDDASRNYDSMLEYEANQLGFTLLVPKVAALSAIEDFDSLMLAADFYGVSVSLLTARIQISDAARWARNRAFKRRNGY